MDAAVVVEEEEEEEEEEAEAESELDEGAVEQHSREQHSIRSPAHVLGGSSGGRACIRAQLGSGSVARLR
jgi:hypothetical protein